MINKKLALVLAVFFSLTLGASGKCEVIGEGDKEYKDLTAAAKKNQKGYYRKRCRVFRQHGSPRTQSFYSLEAKR